MGLGLHGTMVGYHGLLWDWGIKDCCGIAFPLTHLAAPGRTPGGTSPEDAVTSAVTRVSLCVCPSKLDVLF